MAKSGDQSVAGIKTFTQTLKVGYPGGQLLITGGALDCGFYTLGSSDDILKICNWDDATKGIAINLTSGKVGFGTTSPGYRITCNGEPGANSYTAWTNYSDIRFKQDITPLPGNILNKLLGLNPVTFSYNDKNPWGEKPGERRLYGFIAQELQGIFPDMVGEVEGPDGEKYLTTNLSNLTLYLVQAIKEQQVQIEALRTKLN